jgi:hypothetical protein
MKKTLTFLTGIVFLIAILVAVGCKAVKMQVTTEDNEETITESELPPAILADDSTVTVVVYDTMIGCRKHLVMQNVMPDERSKKVVDTLTTVVRRGFTVVWVKVNGSELRKVHQVRIMDSSPWNTSDSCLAGEEEIVAASRSYIKFVIPLDANPGTVKYEVIFEDKDKNYWYIDPHLKIPPPT